MGAILTEQQAVLYGLPSSAGKAAAITAQIVRPLHRLVPVDSVVAAVGELGRCDGWDYAPTVLYVDGAPAHVRLIIDELLAVTPGLAFVLNSGNIMHQVHLLDARHLWGRRALPAAPAGDAFAQNWARLRTRQRHQDLCRHPQHPQVGIGGVDDWTTARTIMQLAGYSMPATLDLPRAVQLLYVARNMQQKAPGTDLRPVRAALGEWAADALDQLAVERLPVADVARRLHGWLLDASAARRLALAL